MKRLAIFHSKGILDKIDLEEMKIPEQKWSFAGQKNYRK